MNYKAKFNAHCPAVVVQDHDQVKEGDVYFDENNQGVFVFIPFTNTQFFEPVKVRKFEVEVNESDMHFFTQYVERHECFSVKEITE